MSDIKTVTTPDLVISYHDHGPASGWPVILSHGFPYAPCLFDAAIPFLTSRGARVIVPYLRGFGPTAFRSLETTRSGQQAALGSDLMALADALFPDDKGDDGGRKPILAGFDWGGVASCTAAALWPSRVAGLVSYAGYDVVDVAAQARPSDPSLEAVMWYQHLVSFFYNSSRSLDWVFSTIIFQTPKIPKTSELQLITVPNRARTPLPPRPPPGPVPPALAAVVARLAPGRRRL